MSRIGAADVISKRYKFRQGVFKFLKLISPPELMVNPAEHFVSCSLSAEAL